MQYAMSSDAGSRREAAESGTLDGGMTSRQNRSPFNSGRPLNIRASSVCFLFEVKDP